MKQPQTIVCFGDSITNNHDHPSYVDYWQELCDAYYKPGNFKLVAAGINGETAYDAYDRLETDVFLHHPDLVTIMYGHNDISCSISPRVFQFHLEKLITKCRKYSIETIWLLTPNQINYPLIVPAYTPYLEAIKSLSQVTGTTFINIWNKFNDLNLDDLYDTDDYLHPNEQGHRLIAERLMKQLQKTK